MTSRRGNPRLWRRMPGERPRGGAVTPRTIVTSSAPIAGYRADQGITVLSGGVRWWNDISGNNRHLGQAALTQRPVLITSDSLFGGRGSVEFDGSDDFLSNVGGFAWALISAGYQPFFWFVFAQTTWITNGYLWTTQTNGGGYLLMDRVSTPFTAMYANGAAQTNFCGGAAVGSAVRGRVQFTGSAADYTRLGSVTATGNNAGPGTVVANFYLGSLAGNSAANYKLAELWVWPMPPTAGELTGLDTYAASYYAGAIGL